MKVTVTYKREGSGMEEVKQEGRLTTAIRGRLLEAGLDLAEVDFDDNGTTETWASPQLAEGGKGQ